MNATVPAVATAPRIDRICRKGPSIHCAIHGDSGSVAPFTMRIGYIVASSLRVLRLSFDKGIDH